MFGRSRIRGLMAQAAYEELDLQDREALDRALKRSKKLRAEAEALGVLVDLMPGGKVVLDGDIGPAVRAGIRIETVPLATRRIHLVVSFAAFALVLAGVGYMISMQPPVAHAPGVAEAPADSVEAATPVDAAMRQARALMLERKYPSAYVTLDGALEDVEDDAYAGEARQLMADLAYSELRWYPEALADYDILRVRHSAVFQSKPENLLNLNLLDEARGRDGSYASLHRLDAARRGESFDGLERLLVDYPATYVASLAADEMSRLSARLDGTGVGEHSRVTAMESALARCTDPLARGQLKVEIGHLVSREMNGADRARTLYEEVAESESTALAELAQNSLARLNKGR